MNDKMRLLGIVITYYPNIEETKRNIMSYIQNVEKLIIWENTPLYDRSKYKISIPEYENKILYMGEQDNMFIAYPLNCAIKFGQKNGFTHILTMDQDSYFEEGHFKKYKQIIFENSEKIAIYGPNTNDGDKDKSDIPHKKHELITSGNIINLALFSEIGFFREDYQIDCVDIEFCARARRDNYDCLMVGSVVMKQRFGNTINIKGLFYTSNYPPFRLYYISRNNILFFKEYPWSGVNRIINYILKPTIKILLSENQKMGKILSILKGIKDGIFYRQKK
jgi:rhamnosyltransferase